MEDKEKGWGKPAHKTRVSVCRHSRATSGKSHSGCQLMIVRDGGKYLRNQTEKQVKRDPQFTKTNRGCNGWG